MDILIVRQTEEGNGRLSRASKKSGCLIVAAVVVIGFALNICMKSPEQRDWDYATYRNNSFWYENYIASFPTGKHIDEARRRLRVLHEKSAGLTEALAKAGLAQSLGGRIVALAATQGGNGVFIMNTFGASMWNTPFSEFVELIGVRTEKITTSVPPFSIPTVVFEHTEEDYGEYELKGLFSRKVRGIAATVKISLFLPRQTVPDAIFTITGRPPRSLRLTGTSLDNTESSMRAYLSRAAYSDRDQQLRRELAISEIYKSKEVNGTD